LIFGRICTFAGLIINACLAGAGRNGWESESTEANGHGECLTESKLSQSTHCY